MKIFKLTTLSLAVFVLAAVIYSCSKQDETEPAGSASEISQSEADILIENKISAFKGKMEFLRKNPSYKSGETMSVDSAVWYMEAASNQTYGDGASPIVETIIDTFSVKVTIINNEIGLNEVVSAYDEMIANLSTGFYNINAENKHLVVNDVSLASNDGTSASFGVAAVFGVGGAGASGTGSIFNYAWYFGMLMGREDGAYVGTSDAAEEIEKMIHQRKGTPPPNSYYLNIDSVACSGDDFINPNDPIPNDNMYDYLMFYNIDDGVMPNVHDLLSINEMDFYLLGTEQLIYTVEPNGYKPTGKSFVSIDLDGEILLFGNTYRLHTGWVRYGTLHINSDPPSDL